MQHDLYTEWELWPSFTTLSTSSITLVFELRPRGRVSVSSVERIAFWMASTHVAEEPVSAVGRVRQMQYSSAPSHCRTPNPLGTLRYSFMFRYFACQTNTSFN